MPKPELEFFDPISLPDRPIEGVPGLTEKILSQDPETGDYARLLIWQPGTDTTPMGVQKHDFWEEVWILEGSIHDLVLDQTFVAGMYACRPPGMPHGPWRSPEGCKTLEIRYYRPKAR
ncbi:MAG TPA: cupin domain-containing protein [Dehalococcoidia bacterium]|nr:cupin domain-containing protein [Dehalococcoidia bacterium]